MQFSKTTLSICMLTALSCNANAQESDDVEVIEVLGTYSKNITKGIDEKRFNENIVDVIFAEDIGKFPDLTTADALQRVPGVQVSRGEGGETSGVVIRGLPNVITTINGRTMFSTAGRGFAFQDLPAEALAGLEVYKSRSAEQVEGGIAGLVNIKLRKPTDFEGFKAAGTARFVNNEHAGEVDPVLSGLISNRWDVGNGELGILVNATTMDAHFQQSNTFSSETLASTNTPDGSVVGVPLSVGIVSDKGLREREQVNVAVQYLPSDNLEIYMDGMYASLERASHTIFGIGFTSSEPLVDIQLNPDQSLCVDVGGNDACYVDSATVLGAGFLAGTHAKTESVGLSQTAVGFKWNIGTNLFVHSDLSFTDTDRQFENFIQDWWLQGGADITFETNVNNHANFDVANDKQLDPNNYGPGGLFEPWDDSEGSELAFKTDVTYMLDTGMLKDIEFGFRYADRDALFIAGDRPTFDPVDWEGAAALGRSEYLKPVDLGGATYLDLKGFYAADYEYMIKNKAKIRSFYGLGPDRPDSDPLRNFEAVEKTLAGYVQAGFDTEVGDYRVDGQIGTRVVKTERTMSSFGTVNDELTKFEETTNSTEVLPNVSVNLHLTDEIVLRSSVSKTISLPFFGDLNPNLFVFPPAPGTPTGSGSGGNPNLSPIESLSTDISLEYYPSTGGITSLTYFHRDVDGYISTYSEYQEIDGVGYNINRPFSSGEGFLEGVELGYSKFFKSLPEPFDGLGVQLNYTYIDGEVSLPDGNGGSFDTALANVSKNNGNAVLMYESDKFFARLAYNYRSDFIESFSTPGIQPETTSNVRAAGRVDASIGYNINESWSMVLDAANLNDEKLYNYWGHPGRSRDRRDPGRTFSLTVSYSM